MRPYYDHGDSSFRHIQFGFGLTRTVKYIILANFLVLVLSYMVGKSESAYNVWVRYLGMYAPYFIRGAIWQPLTYMFLHGGIGHFFWNMLLLFFFASEVERVLGTRRFLRFYFASGAFAGLCALMIPSLPTIGASGACLAVLTAFALYFPDARLFLFPLPFLIKAKYVAIALGGFTVLRLLAGGRPGVSDWGHLGGIAYALFYVKMWPYWKHRLPQVRVPRPRKSKGSSHVLEDEPESDLEVRDKVDKLLEKVHKEGVQSLTRKERKFLEETSKRYQR